MLTIEKYLRPASVEEAYEMAQMKNAVVLGGMLWLRLGNRRIGSAIDLSNLQLNRIEDTGDTWRIGAYTSLRELEMHSALDNSFDGVFRTAMAPIVGVQFRNLATVGGSVYGRFGFSDVITAFMALGASVELYNSGSMPLRDFCIMGKKKDILTHVILPKKPVQAAYWAQRNTATDFPVLNTCAVLAEEQLTVTVGARPLGAVSYSFPVDRSADPAELAEHIGRKAAEKTVLASNKRASAEYRRHLCGVLVRRAAAAVLTKEGR